MENNKRKKLSVMMGAAAMAVLTVGSMAYFTDRVNGTATATARTLDLELTQDWATAAQAKIVPGDKVDFDYTLTNNGNAAMDVKQKFVITVPDVTMNTATPEFAIYLTSDLEQDAAGAWKPKDTKKPLVTAAVENGKATFDLPEIILNGTGDDAETVGGAKSNTTTTDYAILFAKESSNDFQGKSITVDYLAQAKQHKNTDKSTWTTVQSETITFAGNAGEKVVPSLN